MITDLKVGTRRFAAGSTRVVTFAATDLKPTALAMPARLRAAEVAQHLANLYDCSVTALALPPVQPRVRDLPERLRWTSDGEEILSLRSLLAYHLRDGSEISALSGNGANGLRALIDGVKRRGLIAQSSYGEGPPLFVQVGTVGTPRRIGPHLPEAIVTNAHFFVILPSEVDTHHVPLGEAVGLTARAGVITIAPSAPRTALLRTRRGWQVRRVTLDEVTVTLPGGYRVRRGADEANLYVRGPGTPGAHTPVDPAACDIILVGRWAVSVSHGGGQHVPHGAIVVRVPRSAAAEAVEALRRGASVRYGLEGADDLVTALQVGPRLVAAGQPCIDEKRFVEEEFNLAGTSEPTIPTVFPADANRTPAARLAVGVKGDGSLLVVAVEGASALHGAAQADGAGCTLAELAEVMTQLGAREAVNLDGGGSVQVVSGSGALLRPADSRGLPGASFDRPVPTAAVFS